MSAAIRLGRVRGVEVIADLSVLIVAGLLGLAQLLSLDATYDAATIDTVLAIVVVFGYVGSLLLHETLHAIVAISLGLEVRRIRLLVFGGYTLIDDRDAKPSDDFWVAMAGPVGSLVAGGLLWGLAWAVGWNEPTADTLRFLAIINHSYNNFK